MEIPILWELTQAVAEREYYGHLALGGIVFFFHIRLLRGRPVDRALIMSVSRDGHHPIDLRGGALRLFSELLDNIAANARSLGRFGIDPSFGLPGMPKITRPLSACSLFWAEISPEKRAILSAPEFGCSF